MSAAAPPGSVRALYGDASQALRYYDRDGANTLSLEIRSAVQDFIDGTFYRWLH